MRLHISLDDELVGALDRRVGKRRRSSFIARVIQRALEDEQRWDDIEASVATLAAAGHAWDDDAAGWVRDQRHADTRRTG